jgi:hypothetical protein
MQIHEYLGKPWVSMARGENGTFDCWGLVREYYKKELLIDLPIYILEPKNVLQIARAFRGEKEGANWEEIDALEKDCVVVFGFSRASHHIGVCVDVQTDLVLHTLEGALSCCQTLAHIERTCTTEVTRFFKWRGI